MTVKYKGWKVLLEALILEDHVMWWLGVDKEMSLFSPSSGSNHGLYAFSCYKFPWALE